MQSHNTFYNTFFFVKIFQVYLDYEIMVCVCVIVIETGSLEVYHSIILKYAEKRLHFTYDSMRARAQLAVMDNNNNLGRPQAKTQVIGRTTQWISKYLLVSAEYRVRADLFTSTAVYKYTVT